MLKILGSLFGSGWLYAVAFAVAGGWFVWYTGHERAVEHAKDLQKDAALAYAQVAHNEEVEARAKQLTDAAASTYRTELAAPPAADAPHVWVRECAAPAANSVPADAGSRRHTAAAPDGPAAVASGPSDDAVVFADSGRDIGAAVDKMFADDDAEITALQAYVKACVAAGICEAPK